MFGFMIFYKVYLNLGEDCRNVVLGNIFCVRGVSISSMDVDDERVIFRLFGCGVFYQYVFRIGDGTNRVICDERIVDGNGIINNNGGVWCNDFIYRLCQCGDEYEVYCLLKKLL